jgi:trimeric autotransporter adhesin
MFAMRSSIGDLLLTISYSAACKRLWTITICAIGSCALAVFVHGRDASAQITNPCPSGLAPGPGSLSGPISSGACAAGVNSFAAGQSALASGARSAAIGTNAQATNSDSIAISAGAATTRNNQLVLGGPATVVTMPSLAGASSSAQGGPLSLVTTDAGGNLGTAPLGALGTSAATAATAFDPRVTGLDRRLSDGVGLALAAGGSPGLLPGRRFALSTNAGSFNGGNAVSFAFTALIHDEPAFAVAGSAGVGVGIRTGAVGGRGGFSIQW